MSTSPAPVAVSPSKQSHGSDSLGSNIKKTFGKIFSSNWSSDATSSPTTPTKSSGLIGAYRDDGSNTSSPKAPEKAADSFTASPSLGSFSGPPPPITDGRKSTMLAICPQLPPSMQRPEWCMDDYTIMDKLYTGYASTVYKAMCKRSREIVVLKSYALSSICELYQYQIYREVRLHSVLQHENVVLLYAAFQEGDNVVMVQEYADGGDLFALLHKYGGRLSERIAVQMVLDPFLRVLQFLHTRAIIHRDIKPENILFTKQGMCLKLADFGLAIDLRQERAVTRAGTLDYMAPEVLKCPFKSKPEENKEKEHLQYSSTVDSWAVGVLTYELLVGCPPFYDQSRTGTENRIKSGAPAFPSMMSEAAKDFVMSALRKNPLERPTVLDMVHHPWIELFRARRSMRQLPAVNLTSAYPSPAPSTDSSEDKDKKGKAPVKHSVTCARLSPSTLGTKHTITAFNKEGDFSVATSAASSPSLVTAMNSVNLKSQQDVVASLAAANSALAKSVAAGQGLQERASKVQFHVSKAPSARALATVREA